MMRLLRFRSLGFGLLFLGICRTGFSELTWNELKGDHFIIYYRANESFAKEVLRKSESYYLRIGDELGYQRYSNFWSWENRVKIYIHSSQKEYQDIANRPTWSHGMADYENKEIHSYEWKEGFTESLLPHEIAHLVFRDFVGFEGEVPSWLDEGVAQWVELDKRAMVKQAMKSYLEQGKSFSFSDLAVIHPESLPLPESVQLFYVQAVSLIDFLMRGNGADDFIAFCRELRDGKSLDNALEITYPTKMRNINQMEEQWKKYILNTRA